MRLAIIVAFAALSCYGQEIGGKASISGRATLAAPSTGAQTTVYLSHIPGVVLDADLSGAGSQTCTDNTAAINAALVSNTRLILDGASCVSNVRTFVASYGNVLVCIDLWGKSNITIEGTGPSTGFFSRNGANCATISNNPYAVTGTAPVKDTSNIQLRNFRVNGNRASQVCPLHICAPISLWNTSGIVVDSLYLDNYPAFGTQFGNVSNVQVTNNTILGAGTGSDPIHFTGPFNHLTVNNNSLQSGDDCLALNLPEGNGGNGSYVVANNNRMVGSGCSDFVRIYNNIGGGGQPTYTLSNFTVDGLTGTATCSANPAIFYFGEAVGYVAEALSIQAANIDVDGSGNCMLAQAYGTWARFDFSNWTLRNPKANAPAIQIEGSITTSSISNGVMERYASGQSTAWPVQVGRAGTTVQNMALNNLCVKDNGSSFSNSPQLLDITDSASITTLTFGTPLDAKITNLFSTGSAAHVGAMIGPPEPVFTSNTQALITYTAPTTSPCALEVSESPRYSPLVHDVNATLFGASAALDDRAGSLGAGTTRRVVVVGKRSTDLGLDAAYYSRALQTNTTHYWRACGSITGTFTTSNIPLGNTYNEMPQIDSTTGLGVVPTFPDDRTTTVIDPKTGILAKRLWNTSDGAALSLYSGGRIPMCGKDLVGPTGSEIGYLCGFPNVNGNAGQLYYLIPSTGEVRFLGVVVFPSGSDYPNGGGSVGVGYPAIDPADSRVIYTTVDAVGETHKHLLKGTYTGTYASVSPGTTASFSVVDVTPDPNNIGALAAAFDSGFDTAKYKCGFVGGGTYGMLTCLRSIQDSYGWVFMMDMSNGSIVAGTNIMTNPKMRWCGIHSPFPVPNTALALVLPHGLTSGGFGLGPFTTTLTAGINSTDTVITVAGEPMSAYADAYVMDAAVGDRFIIGWGQGGATEMVRLAGKSGNTWTIERAAYQGQAKPAQSWSSGAVLFADCGRETDGAWHDRWWTFLTDPTASGSGLVAETYFTSGHADVEAAGRVAERDGVIGPAISSFNVPMTFRMSLNPSFAGKVGRADGNTYSDYPVYHQFTAPTSEKGWFLDEPLFFGANQFGSGTLVSGQLYRFTMTDPEWNQFDRKIRQTVAASGRRALTDISGPSSSIGTTSGDAFKYCVVNIAGECHAREDSSPSQVGDIFLNVPGVAYTYCGSFEGGEYFDLCVANLGQGQGAYQFGFTANTVGLSAAEISAGMVGAGYTRKLTSGFGGLKSQRKLFKVTADGRWGFVDDAPGLLMVKIPPTPTADGVDRSTFVRAPISIATPGGQGIATATVEFGYAEQGAPSQHYCTSRREACVVVASTVTDVTPFWFANTDTYTRASCATSCTITLPVLPGHAAFWQVKFYDGAGAFVQNGKSGVALESAVAERDQL